MNVAVTLLLEAWIAARQAVAPPWPKNRSGGSSKSYVGNVDNFRKGKATDKDYLSVQILR